MISIFPFLISYTSIKTYLNNISNTVLSNETITIAYILINFINIWFIIQILKIIIKTFKKIINTIL